MNYILNTDGTVTEEPDLYTWGKWFENADNRIVAGDTIAGVRISTVFLGIDHSFGADKPLLFETMVFGGEYDQSQERYCTIKQARAGHNQWLAKVENTEGK